LTDAPNADLPGDGRANQRRFSDEEKLAIVRESEQPGASAAEVCRRHGIVSSMLFRWRVGSSDSQLKSLRKIGEELVGQFLGRAVDQPLAELRQFAADLGLDLIAQQRTAFLFGQVNFCPALREARDATSPSPEIL